MAINTFGAFGDLRSSQLDECLSGCSSITEYARIMGFASF